MDNKNELENFRLDIDNIDKQIVKLFLERMHIARNIAKYKKTNHIEILDANREDIVISNAISGLTQEDALEVTKFMKNLMIQSKEYQKRF